MKIAVDMCGFDGTRRGNYFGAEPIIKTNMEVRLKKFNR